MKKLVLDSSVIVKWLNKNKEDHIEQADNILKDAIKGKVGLFAPELAKYEIGNVLIMNKKLSQLESKIPLAVLSDLPIQFIPQSEMLSKEAHAIASAYGISYYESVFLALSEQKDAFMVTENIDRNLLTSGIKFISLKDY